MQAHNSSLIFFRKVILNPPGFVRMVFKLARVFMSASMMEKVKLCGGNTATGDITTCPMAGLCGVFSPCFFHVNTDKKGNLFQSTTSRRFWVARTKTFPKCSIPSAKRTHCRKRLRRVNPRLQNPNLQRRREKENNFSMKRARQT